MYAVEMILDKKIIYNTAYYLIKWVNYPEEQSTWEPRKNLNP